MRLLFVSHSFPPVGRPLANVGGMQRVATELHAALAAHPNVVLDDILLHTSWRWTHLRTLPFLARAYRGIARRLDENRADAVIFSSMVTATTAVPLRRRLDEAGVPVAAIAHGRDVTLPVTAYQRWLVPRVFHALDAVLPVSRATAEACSDRGLPPSKVHVVPNGVDVDRFPEPEAPAAMRRALLDEVGAELPAGALLLCSVGRQVERKGFAWFVEHVMSRLPGDVHYWLAGEGPEAEAIEAAAAHRDLGPRVRLLGRVPEETLTRLYRGADLFIMPNVPVPGDMEGFGVVMLEAGLNGTPVVAARLEGIRDVVTEGANGHLVPSGDAEAFREVLSDYYDHRNALYELRRRTRAHTVDAFGWTAVADRYVRVVRDLVASKRA